MECVRRFVLSVEIRTIKVVFEKLHVIPFVILGGGNGENVMMKIIIVSLTFTLFWNLSGCYKRRVTEEQRFCPSKSMFLVDLQFLIFQCFFIPSAGRT